VNGINLQLDLAQLEPLIRKVIAETVSHLGVTGLTLRGAVEGNRTSAEMTLLLKPREAAKALSICNRLLWEVTNRGEIPHVRIGRAVRYDPKDLRAWIEQKKRKAP
jgi:excisionase family DNA binding protein